MLRKILCVALVVGAMCAPAFAQRQWVDQFLKRYKPAILTFPANRAVAQDSLATMIRNGEIPISINDLINLTLENNLDIAVQRLTPIQSGYGIDLNYRPFEPTLRIAGSVARDTSQSRSQFTGTSSVTQLSHSYSVGYGQTLKFGADIALDFSVNRNSSSISGIDNFNPSWFGVMRYSYTQRVLNGFGRDVNTRGIRVAQNNKSISEIQFERQVIDLVTTAQKTYWDLAFTVDNLKVKKASLELAEKTLKDNQAQVDAGVMARIDLVQARLQVATRQEELLVSNYTQTQIEDQVKKLVTTQADPGLVLARLSPTQTARRPQPEDVLPVAAAIRVALENRPELRQANLQLRNSEIDIAYYKNLLLPTLDITAGYTQNGVGGVQTLRAGFGPTAPIISVTPGGLGDALGQLIRSQSGGYTLGFNLQIPLTNRAQQAEYAQVSVQRMTTEQNIKALEQQIALEVRNAVTQLEMNRARIETARESRALADEQYAAEQKKFELGASTIRFVLEEQRNLEQMQSNELAAQVNYAKALVDYDRALGMTLKKNNVAIEKTLAASK
jgi:outer membrane protein TolC